MIGYAILISWTLIAIALSSFGFVYERKPLMYAGAVMIMMLASVSHVSW